MTIKAKLSVFVEYFYHSVFNIIILEHAVVEESFLLLDMCYESPKEFIPQDKVSTKFENIQGGQEN